MTKDLLKQCQSNDISIGGIHCPCCFDLPNKKKVLRRGRKRLKTQTMKEINNYFNERKCFECI